jgi:hypothetical protein
MIRLAGLGDDAAEGEDSGVGRGSVLGVGLAAAAVDGVTSGEVVGCWLMAWVQLDSTKTNPATKVTGTAPLLTKP